MKLSVKSAQAVGNVAILPQLHLDGIACFQNSCVKSKEIRG